MMLARNLEKRVWLCCGVLVEVVQAKQNSRGASSLVKQKAWKTRTGAGKTNVHHTWTTWTAS